MNCKAKFKHLRDSYVIRQVSELNIPQFPAAPVCRNRITFSGRVQKVGFRLATVCLAQRLGLTGFCKNLENGSVVTELQGTEEQIRYLVSFLESRKRIRIRQKVTESLSVTHDEVGFQKL